MSSCSGGGSSGPGFFPVSGALVEKPGGGFFLSDPHHGGQSTRIELVEVGWGRLVDVHDVDEQGRPSAVPVLRDVVIDENFLSDGSQVRLETNQVTHESRLVVLRPRNAPDTGSGTFESILAQATRMGGVLPKTDDGTAALPVSVVPRDAVLVLRFDDLLEDGPEAREALPEMVRLLSGYPPDTIQPARTIFDPSHGGVIGGAFHSTRVLVDCTVSAREAAQLPYFRQPNAAGLPASSPLSLQPNAALRIGTRTDPINGRFTLLTNLAGRGLVPQGPADPATGEIVRAFRAGNTEDANSGFLLDLNQPNLLGTWEAVVEAARAHPVDEQGFGFLVDLAFDGPCRAAPLRGDTILVGGDTYEVLEDAGELIDGRSTDVHVVRLEPDPVEPGSLLGVAEFSTPYRDDGRIGVGCWVRFVPAPTLPPAEGVSSDAHVIVRFTEPMEPSTFLAFDTFRILRGADGGLSVPAEGLVIGAVEPSQDLLEFRFRPRLPLRNTGALEYRVELVGGSRGVKDFSGTPLRQNFGRALFALAPGQPPANNAGIALRFDTNDEMTPPGLQDWRGQVTFDQRGGIMRPRPVNRAAYDADRSSAVPNLMNPWPFGVQTPLSPLGSKLQSVWRYVDFGFRIRDENFYNLDVVGMSWSPLNGAVVSDVYPLFEMRMAHSKYMPDETQDGSGATRYLFSGLQGKPILFTQNILDDPASPQKIVHAKSLGYVVRPSDLYLNAFGTPFMPYPWNRTGGPFTSFTWRDTAVFATGGERSSGIPMDIEVGRPLFLEPEMGEIALAPDVPSIGLPLLWEIRCYPTSSGFGFNSFDIMIPVIRFATPYFRAFSTGGIDETGRQVERDPDFEETPQGGFNPNSSPPGRPTPLSADSSFYVGQLDTVMRVSRVVSAWFDTGAFQPRFGEPVIEPAEQPGDSRILMEFRGASGFSSDAGTGPYDAAGFDPYGEFAVGTIFHQFDGSWREGVQSVNGARYVQMRFSFIADVLNGLTPSLDSFGLAYED